MTTVIDGGFLRNNKTKTGKHIHTINGHKAWISFMKISSDGENILSTDLKGIVKIWKIKGGKEICEVKGHTARVREADFHPIHKNTVVSVGNDNTIRICLLYTSPSPRD